MHQKALDPVRSPKLSWWQPSQYYGWWQRGNTGCCNANFFVFYFLFDHTAPKVSGRPLKFHASGKWWNENGVAWTWKKHRGWRMAAVSCAPKVSIRPLKVRASCIRAMMLGVWLRRKKNKASRAAGSFPAPKVSWRPLKVSSVTYHWPGLGRREKNKKRTSLTKGSRAPLKFQSRP